MSMTKVCKCNLIGSNVNQELLKKSVDFVRKQHGGRSVSTVQNKKVIAGFSGGNLSHGLGVCQNGGKLEFIYDSDDGRRVGPLKKEIENTYKKMSFIKALYNEGNEVEVEKASSHVVRIRGRKKW